MEEYDTLEEANSIEEEPVPLLLELCELLREGSALKLLVWLRSRERVSESLNVIDGDDEFDPVLDCELDCDFVHETSNEEEIDCDSVADSELECDQDVENEPDIDNDDEVEGERDREYESVTVSEVLTAFVEEPEFERLTVSESVVEAGREYEGEELNSCVLESVTLLLLVVVSDMDTDNDSVGVDSNVKEIVLEPDSVLVDELIGVLESVSDVLLLSEGDIVMVLDEETSLVGGKLAEGVGG